MTNRYSSHNYNNTNTPHKCGLYPWEKTHRTVRVICESCRKESTITLYGFTYEYRDLMQKEECMFCKGNVTTNDLPKPRKPKPVTSPNQLVFAFKS